MAQLIRSGAATLVRLLVRPKPGPLISNILYLIVQGYFGPSIEWQAEAFSSGAEDKDQIKNNLLQEQYKPMLRDRIMQRLGEKTAVANSVQAAADQVDTILVANSRLLYVVLCQSVEMMAPGLPYITTKDIASVTLENSVVAVVARAIQDVALEVPPRFYPGKERVPEQVHEYLDQALKKIENVRQEFLLASPVLSLVESTSQLHRQIALADGYVWLPFQPLTAAPLSKDDLQLYARDEAPAARLARQIVRGDGVILITGYRGVGKSTFINAALQCLGKTVEGQQTGGATDSPWHIVPITVSIAKTRTVYSVLRLCIRKSYETLMSDEYRPLLNDEELVQLRWASLRATRDVNVQATESLAKSRQFAAKVGIDVGEAFPKSIGGGLLSWLPSAEAKTERQQLEKYERTLALPKYDEDQAEDDIVCLIELLARPRDLPNGETIRIKLVFVFDELDKLDEKEEQMPLIKQLKNLFLTRHAVFLVVTSKEFYYLWLAGRRKEDAVLSSYFSSVVMVPLFVAADTARLLLKLLAVPPDLLSSKEQQFVDALAFYLTNRATGVPREIVREMQEELQWDSLQPYLTDRSTRMMQIGIYAEIQKALESMDNATGSVESESKEITPPGSETSRAPEYIWMDEARQEQIRRGRYVLVEELLNQGSLELKEDVLKPIYDDNFRMVLVRDFMVLVNQLADSLQRVHLSVEGKEVPLASLQPAQPVEGGSRTLVVALEFYKLTGRRAAMMAGEVEELGENLTPEQRIEYVADLLQQNQPFALQRTLRLLKDVKDRRIITADIRNYLYKAFVTSGNEALRLEAAAFLTGSTFLDGVRASYPDQFVQQETSEPLLRRFVDLAGEAGKTTKNRSEISKLLLALLSRPSRSESNVPSTPAWPLPVAVVGDIVDRLARMELDVLKQVVGSLDPRLTIPDSLTQSLVGLAQSSNHSRAELLDLLCERNLAVSSVERLIETQDPAELSEILECILPRRQAVGLARQVLISILLQLPSLQTEPQGILEWLNTDVWTAVDQGFLEEVARRNSPSVYHLLNKYKDQKSAAERLNAAIRVVEQEKVEREKGQSSTRQKAPAAAQKPTTSAEQSVPGNYLLTTFAVLIMVGVYIAVPFDLPQGVSVSSRLVARLLDFLFLFCGIGGALFLLVGLAMRLDKAARDDSGGAIVLGGVMLVVGAVCFLILLYAMHHPITLGGQAILSGILVLTYLIPYGMWSLTRKTRTQQKSRASLDK